MRKSTTVVAAVAAATIVSGTALAEPVKLKLATFTPAKEPTHNAVMVPFAKGASMDSEGTLQIDTFPGGTLGKNPRAYLKLTLDKVMDIGFIVTSYTAGRFPDHSVFELPGLFKDVNESTNTAWRLYEKGKLRGFENIFVVGLFQTHPFYIHTKPKVATLADLKGLKLRAAGPTQGASLRALGANPVGMPAPAIAENISRGVIDGTALNFNGHYAFRIKDVATNTLVSSTGGGLLGTSSLAMVMNKERFDGLPAKAREAILKHRGQQMANRFVKLHDGVNSKLMAGTDKNPELTITRLSAEDQKIFDQKMAKVVEDWAAKHERGKELLAAARAEVRAIRAGN